MSARARHTWLTWLLPLFILRAFVPAGFMLTWSGHELQMIVCSGTGPAALQAPNAHLAHADHSHHAGGPSQPVDHSQHEQHGTKVHEGSYCPFAVAGSAGLPTVAYVFGTQVPTAETFGVIALPELRSASLLIDRIRGPPIA